MFGNAGPHMLPCWSIAVDAIEAFISDVWVEGCPDFEFCGRERGSISKAENGEAIMPEVVPAISFEWLWLSKPV